MKGLPRRLAAVLLSTAAVCAGAGEPAGPGPAAAPGRLAVELRDNDSREAAAARVRVSSREDAREFAPPKAPAAGEGFFLADGSAELELAPGDYRLQVDGGRLRLPYDAPLRIEPGRTERKVIYLVRPEQMNFDWLPADPLFSPSGAGAESAALAARAAGLGAVGIEGLDGGARVRGGPVLLAWRLRSEPHLGTSCRLWSPGSGSDAAGLDFYVDAGRPRRVNPWRTIVPWHPELRDFYDPLVEATAGFAPRMYYQLLAGARVGGFELDGSPEAERLWFALLSEGWRVPALAGTRGAGGGALWPEPRMLLRRAGSGDAAAALVRRIEAGRSTISFGPFCFLAVEGRGAGEELPIRDATGSLKVRAVASTARRAEISRVELYRNGRLFRKWAGEPGQTVVDLDDSLRLDEPGWLVAKCYQRIRPTDDLRPAGGPDAPGTEAVAITNPVWLVPTAYRGGPEPVRTELVLKIVDAGSKRPLAATVLVLPERKAHPCPAGEFRATLSPLAEIEIRAEGFAPRRVRLPDELGLAIFAKRLAGRAPEEVLGDLTSPGALNLLRATMSRRELTLELRPADRAN